MKGLKLTVALVAALQLGFTGNSWCSSCSDCWSNRSYHCHCKHAITKTKYELVVINFLW